MSYYPHKGRTIKELEYYLSVCRKNGYHCVFPYGWSLESTKAHLSDTLRPPIYPGWTLRVFFYAVEEDVGKSQVKIFLDAIQQSSDFIATEVIEDGFVTTYGKKMGSNFSAEFSSTAEQGDHFSIGIQVDTKIPNFKGLFNDRTLAAHNLNQVDDLRRWSYSIIADTNIITSIHIYEDLERSPAIGLGSQFFLTFIPLPVASYALFNLVYIGTSQFFRVTFKDNNEDRRQGYYSTGLENGQVFTVQIRNTPTGWLVQPSFQKGGGDLLSHKYIDNAISPTFENARIERIYMESSVGS